MTGGDLGAAARRQPIRVLYSFPHTIGAPGIGVTALNQVLGLRSAGADVTVLCTSVHDGVDISSAEGTLTLWGRRVPHRVMGSVDHALRYHDRRVAALVSRGAYDVVHTWPLGALQTLRRARAEGVLAAREAPNSHTAVAYRLAEEESRQVGIAVGRGHSHFPSSARLARELQEYDAADLILAPSEHVEQSFLARGTPPSKLARHQYGFDPGIFHAIGRDDAPDRPFTALFLGSAEPRKGLHYALEAWHESGAASNGTLLIAGTFADGYREILTPMLEHPSVKVLGFVTNTSELLRSSDVLLLPSVEEGSALVTYEAQASGCIPLVSRSSGALLVHEREGLLHEPRDVRTLAEHIRLVAGDPALRQRLRTAGVSAAGSLTWEAAGVRLLRIYADALAGRRG
jgi:glycosyltransferase involved in cell wall biosynthesis